MIMWIKWLSLEWWTTIYRIMNSGYMINTRTHNSLLRGYHLNKYSFFMKYKLSYLILLFLTLILLRTYNLFVLLTSEKVSLLFHIGDQLRVHLSRNIRFSPSYTLKLIFCRNNNILNFIKKLLRNLLKYFLYINYFLSHFIWTYFFLSLYYVYNRK